MLIGMNIKAEASALVRARLGDVGLRQVDSGSTGQLGGNYRSTLHFHIVTHPTVAR